MLPLKFLKSFNLLLIIMVILIISPGPLTFAAELQALTSGKTVILEQVPLATVADEVKSADVLLQEFILKNRPADLVQFVKVDQSFDQDLSLTKFYAEQRSYIQTRYDTKLKYMARNQSLFNQPTKNVLYRNKNNLFADRLESYERLKE